jgi:hypothetical protein
MMKGFRFAKGGLVPFARVLDVNRYLGRWEGRFVGAAMSIRRRTGW